MLVQPTFSEGDMFQVGQVISYMEMCQEEGAALQRGMNFRRGLTYSVILMSLRKNAPYADRVEDQGRTLIYEGHDVPKKNGVRDPKSVDQPRQNPRGSLTDNGKFEKAALQFKADGSAHLVRVYEKIHSGIWVYNGTFSLLDAWQEKSEGRKVFKFKLELTDEDTKSGGTPRVELDHNRMIPSSVKLEVWKRDAGKCRLCGSKTNLHYDHILPYSKGGTSLKTANIQILCAKHNLEKRDKIE
jgi:hypothetical protein